MGVFNVSSVNEGFDYTPSELDTVNADNIMMAENFAQSAIMDAADYIQEHSDLIRLMAGQEISITESGQEVVYEASTLEGIGDKIKALIKKAIEKIKALISKLVAVFDSWVQGDKDFINKYSKTFTTNWVKVKKLKVKAYKYHNDVKEGKLSVVIPNDFNDVIVAARNQFKVQQFSGSGSPTAEASIESINKVDATELADFIRGHIFKIVTSGSSVNNLTSKEFSEELHEFWRNGDSAKEEMDKSELEANGYSAANIISKLQNGEKASTEAKKGFAKTEKSLKKWEKDHIDKELKKETKFNSSNTATQNKEQTARAAYYTFMSSVASTAFEAIHTATGIFAQLAKEYSRTCKSIATKVVAMGEKRLAQEESYDFGNDDENNADSYMSAVIIK